MPKALIVFASMTGNTEDIAVLAGEKLKKLGVAVEVEEAMQVEAEEFLEADICVVATYTYGTEGELPDEILDFYEDLEELDLSGKIYGILGSGQDFYKYFCRAVDFFEEQLDTARATRGSDSLKFELNAQSEEDEAKVENFAKELLAAYQKKA